jgi:hypothetical protein
MEKVRLLGRLVDVLDGAKGHLTQLSLLSIGSLSLKVCLQGESFGPLFQADSHP